MHDVAVLHHIVLSFHTHLAGFANGSFRTILYIVLILNDFRTNEALLEVCVDDAGTLRSLPTSAESPGFHFHFASCNKGLQGEQVVDGFDEAIATALRKTEVFQEHLFFLVSLEFCNVRFRLC